MLCIKYHQIWLLIEARHQRASARRGRVEQGLAAVVRDEVAVTLEHHLASSVAVGSGFAGGPDDAPRIGVSEDDNVAVAIEVHVDAVVELAERTRGNQLEGPSRPRLSRNGPGSGGE